MKNNSSQKEKLIQENVTFDTDILTKEVNNLLIENSIQCLSESSKVDLTEILNPPPVAMNIISNGKMIPLFTKGNFSIIAGPPKSRKTGLISMLMANSVNGGFQDYLLCPNNGLNILFDTEQAKYKTQQIGRKICYLTNKKLPDNLIIYSLREHDPDTRLAIIENVLESNENINFVAIDGIIDLAIDPILQAEQAQKIIQKLMVWTEKFNTHITCVLHYNKTASTLLGHLGSFGIRKADAVIEVTKDKENEDISIVTAIACREREFEPFAFTVDEFNNPQILVDYEVKKSKKVTIEKPIKKPVFSVHNIDEINLKTIVESIFKVQKEQSYSECWKNIKLTYCELIEPIGDNHCKDILTYLIHKEIITKSNSGNKAIYMKSGQRIIQV